MPTVIPLPIGTAVERQIDAILRAVADLDVEWLGAIARRLRKAADEIDGLQSSRSAGLIPSGTICPLQVTFCEQRSQDGADLFDCEFTVTEGPFAKRRFSTAMVVDGATPADAKVAEIDCSRLRAMIESAYNIKPDDDSEKACALRRLSSLHELDGLKFLARVGIANGGNIVEIAITPDRAEYEAATIRTAARLE